MAGISESTLRRREKDELPPIVDENGVHRHSKQRVLEYRARQLADKGGRTAVDGEMAAAAFELFDADRNPVDVVKLLHLEPLAVRVIHREWADLRGGFFVGGEAALKVEDLASAAEEGVRNGEDLLRMLEKLELAFCACCKRRTPHLCLSCYHRRPPRADKLVAAAIAEMNARNEERAERDINARAAKRARVSAERVAPNRTEKRREHPVGPVGAPAPHAATPSTAPGTGP
jgi:hypothetical protein